MEIAHKTEFVTVSDGAKIALHSWVPKNFSGCVVHISHGMAEYALRYDSFARFLAEQGYTVFAHDHRGHGQSIQDSAPMGHLADKDGLWRVINDLKEIIEYTKKTYPESKYVLFAHSFGSFAAQVFITFRYHFFYGRIGIAYKITSFGNINFFFCPKPEPFFNQHCLWFV